MGRWAWAAALVALFMAGCIEDETTPDGADGAAGAGGLDVDGGGGGGTDDDAGSGGAGGSEADAAMPIDQGRDAAPDQGRDMALPPVETCQQACDRYAACERFDVWGDEGACLDACARAERSADVTPWFECVQIEACGLLQLCRLPEPPALTCAEVCAAADDCGVALPFANCEAHCEASEQQAALVACGESLLACDGDGFEACLAESVFPGCGRRCARTQACNIEGDTCLADCVRAGADADPLRRVRQRERNQCVGTAGDDCARVDQCLNPSAPPVADEAEFCRSWNRCFAAFGLPCEAVLNDIIPPGAENRDQVLACGIAAMRVCPQDPFVLVERCVEGNGGPGGPTCLDLCTAQNVCGVLPEGVDAFACNQRCLDAQRADGDAARRIAATLPCAQAERCDELDACLLENSPAGACAEYCQALDACGAAPEGCAERCDARYFRLRDEAARACVLDAGDDCAAITECLPEPAIGCDAACARAAECARGEPQNDCQANCDDADFADRATNLAAVACVLTAPVCSDDFDPRPHAVDNCQTPRGLDCLGRCQAEAQCLSEPALVECLTACGAGREGDVAFAVANACYAEHANGACDALEGCAPDAAPCDAWCGAVAACDLGPADCPARCAEDPLTQVRAHSTQACVAAAGDDCRAIERCLSPEPEVEPPVDIGQANFCRLYNDCRLNVGSPCDEFYQFLAPEAGEAGMACMVRAMETRCPDNEFELFDRCVDAQIRLDPRRAPCEALCHTRALCGDLAPGDLRTCRAECIETFADPRFPRDPGTATRLEAVLPCAQADSCEAMRACRVALEPESQCRTHCAALDGCGLVDAEACAATCDQRFGYRRDTAWRACVRAAGDDCEAIAACTPQRPDCAGYCRDVRACGLGEAGQCELRCDDAHFDDPATQALRIACVQNTEQCFAEGRPGQTSIEQCVFGDPTAGLDPGCAGYCRAVTECDREGERGFDRCIQQCAEGFEGDEGLTYAAARGCVVRAGQNAACDALRACLPAEPPAIDCAAFCGAVDGCGFPNACACTEDRAEAGCVAEAVRTEAGCEGIAQCLGFEVVPANLACEQICARYEACEPGFDGFVCRQRCTREGPDAGAEFRAACMARTQCERLPACDEVRRPHPGCVDACARVAECGAPESCVADCTGALGSPDIDDGVLECLGQAADARACGPAVARCLNPVAGLCEAVCRELRVCGINPDGDCIPGCNAALADPESGTTPESLNCMLLSLQNRCDIDAVERCAELGEP